MKLKREDRREEMAAIGTFIILIVVIIGVISATLQAIFNIL